MNDESSEKLGDTLRWALEAAMDPAMAAADWLARDIDVDRSSAVELLTCPDVSRHALTRAKDAFKTMRIVGETSADRRVGARLYAASIAAGLVHHGVRISRQSDGAIMRALRGLMDDPHMPPPLREMAGKALVVLARGTAGAAPNGVEAPPLDLIDGGDDDEDDDDFLPMPSDLRG